MDIKKHFHEEFALEDEAVQLEEQAEELRKKAWDIRCAAAKEILAKSGFEGKIVKWLGDDKFRKAKNEVGVLRVEAISRTNPTIKFYPLTKAGVPSKNYSYDASCYERSRYQSLETRLELLMKSYEVVCDYEGKE